MFTILINLAFMAYVANAKFRPSPVGIWMMNSASRGRDSSGQRNHAKPHDVKLTSGPMGEQNTAYEFYGRITSYLSIPHSESMDVGANGSFTFTAFVKTAKSTAAFIDYNQNSPYALHIWSYPSFTLNANMPSRSPHRSHEKYFLSLKLTANTWHFIGVSQDSPKTKLIGVVDDKSETDDFGGWKVYTNTSETYLGRRLSESNSFLEGKMSCTMLFNVPLSFNEMQRARKFCMKNAKKSDSVFKKFSDGAIPSHHRLTQRQAEALIQCSRLCHKNDACMSFSYELTTKACVLSNTDFFLETVSTETATGMDVYSTFFFR
ncbi:uncharacterized protein LOC135496965 isoform X2 [Lineus longissimus]|uniref:uncharacterized protein LOC135496965 isoform X2 n=1 Tax=Lineus longissimus TaxID=88925 RepID=UPI00315CC1DC